MTKLDFAIQATWQQTSLPRYEASNSRSNVSPWAKVKIKRPTASLHIIIIIVAVVVLHILQSNLQRVRMCCTINKNIYT